VHASPPFIVRCGDLAKPVTLKAMVAVLVEVHRRSRFL
jgi:hypothetical protein